MYSLQIKLSLQRNIKECRRLDLEHRDSFQVTSLMIKIITIFCYSRIREKNPKKQTNKQTNRKKQRKKGGGKKSMLHY